MLKETLMNRIVSNMKETLIILKFCIVCTRAHEKKKDPVKYYTFLSKIVLVITLDNR